MSKTIDDLIQTAEQEPHVSPDELLRSLGERAMHFLMESELYTPAR